MRDRKLQGVVYDILPPATAVIDYGIRLGKLSANGEFFVGAQKTHARARAHARTHARAHTRTLSRTHTRTHAHTHTYTHTHTHTHTCLLYTSDAADES